MYVFYVLQIFGNKVNLESICRFCDIEFEIIAKIAKKRSLRFEISVDQYKLKQLMYIS